VSPAWAEEERNPGPLLPHRRTGAESINFGSALILVLTPLLPDRHYGLIMRRILLATASFQDTPGEHHELLEDAGFGVARDRGPLPEPRMLEPVSKGECDAWFIGVLDSKRPLAQANQI